MFVRDINDLKSIQNVEITIRMNNNLVYSLDFILAHHIISRIYSISDF
jgi:hypothetical protein